MYVMYVTYVNVKAATLASLPSSVSFKIGCIIFSSKEIKIT